MPFDGTNFKTAETKPDIFSLEGLIAWLETQDPQQTYCYLDTGRCLASQFSAACGHKYSAGPIQSGLLHFMNGWGGYAPLGDCIHDFPRTLETIACCGERTFRAALDRANRLLASRMGA